VFHEEIYSCNSQPALLKIIKSIKTVLKKIIKKIIWGNTVAIHSVLKKKIIKLNSQPAQYEKINSTKTILEKKSLKKNHVGKHCSNPQCFKEKKLQTKFSTSSIIKKKSTKKILKKNLKKKEEDNFGKKKAKKMETNGKKNI